MSPLITLPVNTQQILRIPMTDIDNDIIKCRWANSTSIVASITIDECGGICQKIPKDFMLSDPNDTSLSSIPLQFLVHSIQLSCNLPIIVGDLINSATLYVQANVTFSTAIIAQTG
ncbi:unnamed protein product [Rotaria sp. Silwood1]|nr:unnamed protein product [Rotaria sp. Silwood1]